jgi:hypothetical protein
MTTATCAICGLSDPVNVLFGVALSPATNLDAYQRFCVHPSCIASAFRSGVFDDARGELAEMFRDRGATTWVPPLLPEEPEVVETPPELEPAPAPEKPAPRRRTRRRKDETKA